MARKASKEEYEHLCRVIQRWNEHRVELFEISMPNEVGLLIAMTLMYAYDMSVAEIPSPMFKCSCNILCYKKQM